MKVVIIRSDCGFGDRIITLTTAINYAKKTNRLLVIDWRDHVWCGNNQEYDFDYYYDLKLPNYVPLKKFLTMYEQNKHKLTVWPGYAKVLTRPYNKKQNANFDNAAYAPRDALGYSKDIFVEIIKDQREDIDANVVILYQYVTRPIQTLRHFTGLIMKEPLKIKVNEDPFKINVLDKGIKYNVVHLRGTDRMNENSFKNGSGSPEEYTEMMYNKIQSDIKDILLISDTQVLIDTFIRKYNNKFIIHQTNNKKSANNKSLHNQEAKNKIKLNIEMLKDFYFLLRSENIYTDGISYFSMCPHIIKKYSKCKTEEDIKKVDNYIIEVGSKMGIPVNQRALREKELREKGLIIGK
jgi:hypothetical protein